ncbi:MAG: RNA polymerase sigma factor [Gemmatimonadaceae bacterium]
MHTSATDVLFPVNAVSPRTADEQRFAALLSTYAGPLQRLCALYERNAAERDDMMQEIAFALWRALPTFRGDCSERTFIFRIAHNRVLSWRFRRRLSTEPLDAAADVVDGGPGPDDRLERASERAHLLSALRQLPEHLREPVVLRLEGLSDREISGVMGISEGNVAVRLTRARQALRVIFETSPPSDRP